MTLKLEDGKSYRSRSGIIYPIKKAKTPRGAIIFTCEDREASLMTWEEFGNQWITGGASIHDLIEEVIVTPASAEKVHEEISSLVNPNCDIIRSSCCGSGMYPRDIGCCSKCGCLCIPQKIEENLKNEESAVYKSPKSPGIEKISCFSMSGLLQETRQAYSNASEVPQIGKHECSHPLGFKGYCLLCAEELPTVPPKVGKRYRMRNGEITGEMRMISEIGMLYPFSDEIFEFCWTEKGKYLAVGITHDGDLVEELDDEPRQDDKIKCCGAPVWLECAKCENPCDISAPPSYPEIPDKCSGSHEHKASDWNDGYDRGYENGRASALEELQAKLTQSPNTHIAINNEKLSRRDYFAAMAMHGFLTSTQKEIHVRAFVKWADALIGELDKAIVPPERDA
jgi:hypothetical protein